MSAPLYQINRPVHEGRHRRYRRRSRFLTFLLLVVLVAVGIVIYNILHTNPAEQKSAIGKTFTQHLAGPQTFTSKFFQFSDTQKWTYAPFDSTANKVTYLLYSEGVPAHSLTVYVNQTPLQQDLATSRVLPVAIKEGNTFNVGTLSQPCSTLFGPTDRKIIKTVSLSGTSFLCVPDNPQYTVVVGQIGADTDLMLRRSNGEVARYVILYHNLSVDPDPAPFLRVMKTFKAL